MTLLQTRYLYASPPVMEGVLANMSPKPVLVVAAVNATDWAAYIGGVGYGAVDERQPGGSETERVRTWGAKLPEPVARAFFPDITEVYRP